MMWDRIVHNELQQMTFWAVCSFFTPLETENACGFDVKSIALFAKFIRMVHFSWFLTG
jgi:hypothetical protein